jgi:hypothetical protein
MLLCDRGIWRDFGMFALILVMPRELWSRGQMRRETATI